MNKVTNKHLELAQEALIHTDLFESITVVKDVAQALADAEQQEQDVVLEVLTTIRFPIDRGKLDLVHLEHLFVLLNSSVIVNLWFKNGGS